MPAKPAAPKVTVEVRRGAYRDSVGLMRVSTLVTQLEGVESALVAMGTGLNLELLDAMGGTAPAGTGPNDLIIAVRAADDAAREAAFRRVDEELEAMASGGGSGDGGGPDARPRTVRTAAARATRGGSPATVALVSVPGPHAAATAFEALDSGLDVVVFSDNVPVSHEIALKDTAARLGRIVMGPDCGTAVVGGAGLGFANAVRPGPVGLVAASGTGAQHLMCLLDAAGVGISHCLGVGGRDLSAEVAGRSTLQALRLLDEDPATERIVLVSKPPAPEVAKRVAEEAARLGTPVHIAFLNQHGQEPGAGTDLTAVAEEVLDALGHRPPAWQSWLPDEPLRARPGALRGLFCGGTLADEAMAIASATLGPIASNIPLRPEWALPADLRGDSHLVIDFGDDQLTAGRPHPMIDPSLRNQRLAAELADDGCAAVLLDVVTGYGSHTDPAAGVAGALRSARATGSTVPVVITLCGAESDPQGFAAQAEALRSAGAEVHLSNAAAARRAAELVARGNS